MENNSQQQVNENYAAYRDRMDVNKAWEEWKPNYPFNQTLAEKMKAFAKFYAQRVKGCKP